MFILAVQIQTRRVHADNPARIYTTVTEYYGPFTDTNKAWQYYRTRFGIGLKSQDGLSYSIIQLNPPV